MTKSTIEKIEEMNTVGVDNIPIGKLKDILIYLSETIEKARDERDIVLYELVKRGEGIENWNNQIVL